MLLLSVILSLTFIFFSFLVTKGVFLPIDHFIDQTLILTTNSPIYFASRFLAYFYVLFVTIITVLIIRFLLKKQFGKAIVAAASFSGGVAAEFILKPFFGLACPQNFYSKFLADQEVFGLLHIFQSIGFFETCYPSSHVAAYVVFSGYLAYLCIKHIKEKRQRLIFTSTLYTIIILVGPSRLYLHAHWFSDVIGGYLLGFALLTLIIWLHQKLIR